MNGFICKGKLEEAKLLAANPSCNVNWVDSINNKWTPLMWSSYRGYFDVIKVLLRRQDLLINYQNKSGYSALIWASINGNIRCVELLLHDSRTDVNLVNTHGDSALCQAYYKSRTPLMKLLISHGAANVGGIVESVAEVQKWIQITISAEATEVMENWKLCLPEFTRFAKTNKYYPTEFKEWAFNFILCCLKSRSFPKDIIYLLLEYIARAWKRI